jgi:transcriptional regulator with XRE-family HTH domain
LGSASREQMYDAFGAYVRSQRLLAQLTLRQAAELACISNPYLSQIEHGLARPSIAVISALAEALSVSAETMLLRAAGIVSTTESVSNTEAAICQDPRLDDRQRHALLAVLASFVRASEAYGVVPAETSKVKPAENSGIVPAETSEVDPTRPVHGQPDLGGRSHPPGSGPAR